MLLGPWWALFSQKDLPNHTIGVLKICNKCLLGFLTEPAEFSQIGYDRFGLVLRSKLVDQCLNFWSSDLYRGEPNLLEFPEF